jgi:phosphatidylethanolamine-binding protein (PEBP) family uncharacterized protein
MYDPDAVSPSGKVNFVHMLVVNKTASEPGNTLAEYTKPAPPPGSGVHRYQFNLYKQPVYLELPAITTRAPFDVEGFVSEHGLDLLQTVEFRISAPV